MQRRTALKSLASAAVALSAQRTALSAEPVARVPRHSPGRNLAQSVTYWPYGDVPLDEFCRTVKTMGLPAVDLLQPEEWPVAAKHGLVSSMGYASKRKDFLTRGLCDTAMHDVIAHEVATTLPLAAKARVPNVIVMFGNRQGRPDAEGKVNAIAGLRRLAPIAERHQVTLCVELLNSKVDHKDYQGDHTAFGSAVIQAVGSPRVKLLYDIYHMQIMEGDVIRTIRDHAAEIGHYHTGGVPGRHELDDTQELNYRAIAQAIADTGFTGFLAHEFIPTRPWRDSLRQAVQLCDVQAQGANAE
ncbi:MAG TPA: TIM barrel protein [Gemmatimonadales bacterium]|nr:TIM barrel protein [Gemmatimonadales bacterium]